MDVPLWLWFAVLAVIVAMLAVDQREALRAFA